MKYFCTIYQTFHFDIYRFSIRVANNETSGNEYIDKMFLFPLLRSKRNLLRNTDVQ